MSFPINEFVMSDKAGVTYFVQAIVKTGVVGIHHILHIVPMKSLFNITHHLLKHHIFGMFSFNC